MTKKILALFIIYLSFPLFLYAQYHLGEKEFTQEQEQATVFTSFKNAAAAVKLRDSIDLSNLMPPVGDQGTKGSCWAWATTYVMRSVMDKPKTFLAGGKLDSTSVYSPEYVYQFYKGDKCDNDYGATSADIMDRLLQDGAVKFTDLHYNQDSCNIRLSPALVAKAKKNIQPGYHADKVNDLYSIKKVLCDNQPLVLSIRVDDYFTTKGNITAKSPFWREFGDRIGNHAMVVVGYNDSLKAIKVLNSWGDGFGVHGYAWIAYSIVNSSMNYACYPKLKPTNVPLAANSTQEKSTDKTHVSGDSLSTWFKQGYFRPYDNLKIVLSKLSVAKKSAVIEIRDKDDKLLTNFDVDQQSTKQFNVNGKQYVLTFDNIAHQGMNPFTKAVFFTIKQDAVTLQ